MLDAGAALARYIADHHFAPGEPLNIVAHSEGGDVVKAYTQIGNHSIDNLITLGTPQRDDFVINPTMVKNYFNIYSTNDLVQPLGGKFSSLVINVFIDYAIFELPDWLGLQMPWYVNAVDTLFAVYVEYYVIQDAAGRTDPFAINVDMSWAPGFGAVGHSDLHSLPVWNWIAFDLTSWGYHP